MKTAIKFAAISAATVAAFLTTSDAEVINSGYFNGTYSNATISSMAFTPVAGNVYGVSAAMDISQIPYGGNDQTGNFTLLTINGYGNGQSWYTYGGGNVSRFVNSLGGGGNQFLGATTGPIYTGFSLDTRGDNWTINYFLGGTGFNDNGVYQGGTAYGTVENITPFAISQIDFNYDPSSATGGEANAVVSNFRVVDAVQAHTIINPVSATASSNQLPYMQSDLISWNYNSADTPPSLSNPLYMTTANPDLNAGANPFQYGNGMWTSDGYTATAGSMTINFDLGAAYDLQNIYIWNGNQWDATDIGVRNLTIQGSTNNVTFNTLTSTATVNLTQSTDRAIAYAQVFSASQNNTSIRYVRFNINTTWGGYGGQTWAQLSEVRFTAVPEPSSPSYGAWAATNAGGQAANLDWDNDGVTNGVEFFMDTAPGFTANPALVDNTVTWPNGGNIPSSGYGTQFVVQTSTDLANWSAVASDDITLGNTAGALTWKVASIANGNMDSFPSDLPSSWVVSQGTLTSAPSPDNSPFTNKFADNGISWLIDDSTDTSGTAGFLQAFSNKTNYPSVEVNFDFKLTELTGGTWGIHFDGAGASAIAASSVHYRIDASGQFAINAGPGGIITDILALEADKWYNVRATFTTTEINTIDASSGNGAGFQSGSITPAGGSPVSWSNVPLLNTSLGFSRLLVRDRDATSGGDLLLDNVSVAPQGKEFVRLKVTPN